MSNEWELPKKGWDTPRTTEKPAPMREPEDQPDPISDVLRIKSMFQRVGISFTEIDNGREHLIHLDAPDVAFEPIEFSFDEVGELICVTAAPWYDR